MKYRFNVNLTDKDYLDYNIFWMIKSPYGKKQMLKTRLLFVAIFVIGIFATIVLGDGSGNTYLTVGLLTVWLILLQLFMPQFLSWSLKGQLKTLKKSGKMGFSPDAVMEFFDEKFTETTAENKTEQKYKAIERISIVDDKVIYIHMNNVMAYILPLACFETEDQYNCFVSFISERVANIDTY